MSYLATCSGMHLPNCEGGRVEERKLLHTIKARHRFRFWVQRSNSVDLFDDPVLQVGLQGQAHDRVGHGTGCGVEAC